MQLSAKIVYVEWYYEKYSIGPSSCSIAGSSISLLTSVLLLYFFSNWLDNYVFHTLVTLNITL